MKIALQLYSCRDKIKLQEDPGKVLKQIADMGYAGVEFFNVEGQTPYGTLEPQILREALEGSGLEGLNVHLHLPWEKWFGDLGQELSYAKEVGLPAVSLSYIPPEMRSEDFYRRLIDQFPEIVRQCREYGLKFVYHNHDFEMDAGMGSPLLLEALTKPEGVHLELDTFWAFFKGKDPCALMEQLGEKLKYIHIKDYNALSDFFSMRFTEIGTGKMDNQSILNQAAKMQLPWVIVEQDNSAMGTLESARLSAENLRKMMG